VMDKERLQLFCGPIRNGKNGVRKQQCLHIFFMLSCCLLVLVEAKRNRVVVNERNSCAEPSRLHDNVKRDGIFLVGNVGHFGDEQPAILSDIVNIQCWRILRLEGIKTQLGRLQGRAVPPGEMCEFIPVYEGELLPLRFPFHEPNRIATLNQRPPKAAGKPLHAGVDWAGNRMVDKIIYEFSGL